ncbi:hypothetical protein [Haliea sp. E17]|uniref:hypothetical protein n=1 Tax=Haliea sp. E17 TaxID=3401576 RepID=UPI003AAF7823
MMKPLMLFTAVTLIASNASFAEDSPPASHDLAARHTFLLGAAHQEANADIRASVAHLPEHTVNLDDLGVDESYYSWYAEYRYNFARHWGLVIAADAFNGDGNVRSDSEFNYGGSIIPVDAALKTDFSVNTLFVDLMYTVYNSAATEVSLGAGIHMLDFETSLRARIETDNNQFDSKKANEDLLAPLPNIRGQWIQRLGDKWTFFVTAGWMSANVDEWDGSFVYAHPRVHYRFSKHFGAALGYQFTDVDVTHEGKRVETEFDVELKGPTLTLSYQL